MEFQPCLVCSYAVVDEAFSLECGHIMHKECFDVFLQLENLDCDTCANAQWYVSSGQPEYADECCDEQEYWEHDEVSKHESGFSEAPPLFNFIARKTTTKH